MQRIKSILFCAAQFTWGLPQNLAGGAAYLLLRKKCRQERFHYSFITYVTDEGFEGTTLGMFIFMNPTRSEAWVHDVRIHEYGHTIQSLLLGPLDLLVTGIPSAVWFGLPALKRYRKQKQLPYSSFFTESWANRWGQRWAKDRLLNARLEDYTP
jgi:hypothetical protein